MPTRSLTGMALAQVVLVGIIADGSFYSAAHAQCAPEDKIYIDPRLVPRRDPVSPELCRSLMRPNNMNPAVGDDLLRQCFQQGQPIVVPYGTGKVLVHPTNPCIQQYIP
jgi:hypothetical protein